MSWRMPASTQPKCSGSSVLTWITMTRYSSGSDNWRRLLAVRIQLTWLIRFPHRGFGLIGLLKSG
jgi:hypothetical protein